MEVTFSPGQAGYSEAVALQAVARYAQSAEPADSTEIQLIDQLRSAAEAWVVRPEYAHLSGKAGIAEPASPRAGGGLWQWLFGPGRREILLSEQRNLALERALRAERSAFESIAESAEVGRERDAALARIVELEKELSQDRNGAQP